MITFSLKCELVTVVKLELSFPGRIPRIAPLNMKCKTDISENLSTSSKQESFTFLIIFKITKPQISEPTTVNGHMMHVTLNR